MLRQIGHAENIVLRIARAELKNLLDTSNRLAEVKNVQDRRSPCVVLRVVVLVCSGGLDLLSLERTPIFSPDDPSAAPPLGILSLVMTHQAPVPGSRDLAGVPGFCLWFGKGR